MNSDSKKRIQSFNEFWPYYVSEHKNMTNRRLHVIGTSLAFLFIGLAILKAKWELALFGLFCAYTFAWVGHFVFEGNRPATFKYPLWSLRADLKGYFSLFK